MIKKDSKSKQRLVGAVVLLCLAIILLPLLVDFRVDPGEISDPIEAPPAPPYRDYQSRVVPLEIPSLVDEADDQGAITRDETGVTRPAGKPKGPVASAPTDPQGTETAAKEKPKQRPAAAEMDKGWVVQVGTFGERQRANKLSAQLREKGFTAYIESVETPKGLMHRVRVGPEVLREDAEKAQQRLQQKSEIEGMVLRFP